MRSQVPLTDSSRPHRLEVLRLALTFKRGLRIRPVDTAPLLEGVVASAPPPVVYVPLIQHRGAPAEPIVAVGDVVLKGQKIADSEAAVTAPLHAPVSGRVRGVEEIVPHPSGGTCAAIVIDNDFRDQLHPSVVPFGVAEDQLTPEQVISIAREAGIAGMGGAGFPLSVKLSGARGKLKRLLLNGCECEPLISSDDRLMALHPEAVVGGARLMARAVGLPGATICIEDDKPAAIAAIAAEIEGDDNIDLAVLEAKYPQGGERLVISVVDGFEMPRGKLPADCGYLVANVDTAATLYRAYTTGLPSISRYVTVTGSIVPQPTVFEAPLGTPFSHLIAQCGEPTQPCAKLISGGPMMGTAQYSAQVPTTKTVSCILLMGDGEAEALRMTNCIHCGKCMRGCPMRLTPCYLNYYSDARDLDTLEELNLDNCIECGVCVYNCPARLPMLQKFKLMKLELAKRRRELQQKQRGMQKT